MMIDLHCHLLPSIDDGSKSLQESLQMAAYAVEQGICHAVMTPHIQPGSYDNDINNIRTAYLLFKQALIDQDISLTIDMAAEVRICAELPQMIMQNRIPFLGTWENKNVLLLEFPHDHIPVGSDKLISWLWQRNIVPIIAHPERNQAILKDLSKLMPFIKQGCLIQITASSVTGLFGKQSQECALQLINQGLATVMASDAHNLHKRQPTMRAAVDYLMDIVGEKVVSDLVNDRPAAIIGAVVKNNQFV